MKKLIIQVIMIMMTVAAHAMSYGAAREEALFLSDKMAYELNLTPEQYEAVYEINLDYLLSVNGADDVLGTWWNERDAELRFVLASWQYDRYMGITYFYRPVAWHAGAWLFAVYAHYDRARFYYARPRVYVTYRGGAHRHHPHGPIVHHPGGHRPVGHFVHHPVGHGVHHSGGHRPHGGNHFGGTHRPNGGSHFGGNHSGGGHTGAHVGGASHTGGHHSTHTGGSNFGGHRSGGGHSGGSHSGGGRFGR